MWLEITIFCQDQVCKLLNERQLHILGVHPSKKSLERPVLLRDWNILLRRGMVTWNSPLVKCASLSGIRTGFARLPVFFRFGVRPLIIYDGT